MCRRTKSDQANFFPKTMSKLNKDGLVHNAIFITIECTYRKYMKI